MPERAKQPTVKLRQFGCARAWLLRHANAGAGWHPEPNAARASAAIEAGFRQVRGSSWPCASFGPSPRARPNRSLNRDPQQLRAWAARRLGLSCASRPKRSAVGVALAPTLGLALEGRAKLEALLKCKKTKASCRPALSVLQVVGRSGPFGPRQIQWVFAVPLRLEE
jgi:hypothetical protein